MTLGRMVTGCESSALCLVGNLLVGGLYHMAKENWDPVSTYKFVLGPRNVPHKIANLCNIRVQSIVEDKRTGHISSQNLEFRSAT